MSWSRAAPLALPPPLPTGFAPQAGALLPLDAGFVDERGRPMRLGALFGNTPVVLVPGYYRCRNLCSTLFEGVLQALAMSGLPAGSYQLAGVSIDPADTPALAAARKQAYAAILPGGASDLHLLSGQAAASAAFAHAIGYRASRDRATGELAHPAGFIVASPDGRVARFFAGVRFDPAALRAAVHDAGAGKFDTSLGEQFLLLCAHFDPASGRHSQAAMWLVRAGALASVPLLLLVAVRRREAGR
ncbi:MAG: SCO family protein [Pseudomonadota bacterium]